MRASPGSDAFSKVVREHQTALYRYCRGLTANEQAAEDLLQETFLSAFRGFDGFREESALRTWLFTIARRAAQRLGRRRAGEPAAFEEFQELGAQAGWGKIESPEASVLGQERRAYLANRMALLSAPDREVLILRDLEGLSCREAADVMGVSDAAVRTRLHRARLKFMALAKHGGTFHAG